jgi:hypothetical protein
LRGQEFSNEKEKRAALLRGSLFSPLLNLACAGLSCGGGNSNFLRAILGKKKLNAKEWV